MKNQVIINSKFEGFMSFEDFKEEAVRTIHEVSCSGSYLILSDLSGLKVMKDESKSFIRNDWMPAAKVHGVKKIAFIIPNDPIARLSMSKANRGAKSNYGIDCQYFEKREEAVKWLIS